MGCGSCATKACGSTTPKGCKNNGNCTTQGCGKLSTFDWLADMRLPTDTEDFHIVEVKFKGGRKEFFRNINALELVTGDAVIVQRQGGYDLGYVSLQGELTRFQMMKKHVVDDKNIKSIYRLASKKDIEKHYQVKEKEVATLYRTREVVRKLKLNMKLSDVEFQSDNTKATFYYSSDQRVDFRELIKSLASEFKVRIEMKQINLRQEASRIGGIGSCGRELCCATWLTSLKAVSSNAARYQNLSLNSAKLSGQCGRLKCCLNYELDTYLDALIDIPKIDKPLLTEQGNMYLQKVDIFRKVMWFSYGNNSNWYAIDVKKVKDIIKLNKQGVAAKYSSDKQEMPVKSRYFPKKEK